MSMFILYQSDFSPVFKSHWFAHSYVLWHKGKGLKAEWGKLLLYKKDCGCRVWWDWLERYWLTSLRQSLHLVSQGCCHRDDPAMIQAGVVQPAASGPRADLICCFQSDIQMLTWKTQFKAPQKHACTHTNTRADTHTHRLYICLHLVAMPLPPTRPSRTALELFQASQMIHVTHGDKATIRPSTTSTLHWWNLQS